MIPNLWTRAPRLRGRATRQARALRAYLEMARYALPTCAGRGAEYLARYEASVARDVGYRAGRLMALRMEAYDALHGAAP